MHSPRNRNFLKRPRKKIWLKSLHASGGVRYQKSKIAAYPKVGSEDKLVCEKQAQQKTFAALAFVIAESLRLSYTLAYMTTLLILWYL